MRYSIQNTTVEQIKEVGGTDIKEVRSTGIIFTTLTKEQANRLKLLGCQVNEVGKVQATAISPIVAPPLPVAAAPMYSPEQLSFAAGYEELRGITEPPLYGSGFNLAIIDTGIRETHEKINGHVIYSKNYTSDPMQDGFDHGTGVCSIALAVAPLCNILNMKVLDDAGEGTEEEVALAIDDCISLQDTDPSIAPAVINLSLGGPDDGNVDNPLRVMCRVAIDRGIWIFASAGNSGPAPYSITCPACEQYVSAVGSVKYLPDESTFILSTFSSRGPTKEGLIKPDIILFGEDVIVASSSSDTATTGKSGTSFATPLASGMRVLFSEAIYRKVGLTATLPVSPGELHGLDIAAQTDAYTSAICVKPEGAPAEKDNDYGWGFPLGQYAAKMLQLVPAMDIGIMLQSFMPLVSLSMIAMIITPSQKKKRK